MKKTISITIAGVVFYIEEDGYERLRGYLSAIQQYFSSYEGSQEIVQDIEGRVAEKFIAKQQADAKQAISAQDVDELVRSMGTVADFEAIEEEEDLVGHTATANGTRQTGTPTGFGTTTAVPPTHRKLYRDTRRKLLGGVCAGIAHYFNSDPLWIRLLFLFFFIGLPAGSGMLDFDPDVFGPFSGFIFLLYVALWISFPGNANLEEPAGLKKLYRDPDKKVIGGVVAGVSAYTGWDVGVLRFLFVISVFFFGTGILLYLVLWAITPQAKTLTDKMQMTGEPITLENIETNVKRTLDVSPNQPENTLTKILLFPFRAIAAVFEALGPFFKFLLVLLRIIAGAGLIALAVITLIALIASLGAALGMAGMNDFRFGGDLPVGLLTDASPWMFFAVFGALAVPTVLVALLGVSLLAQRNVINQTVGYTALGVWVLSLAGVAATVPAYVSRFTSNGSIEKTVYLDPKGRVPVLDLQDVSDHDFRSTNLELIGYEGTGLKLVQEFHSQGSSRVDAERYAGSLVYRVQQRDSVFVFDDTFERPAGQPFRGQDLRMKLYIPYGQTFSLTEDFAEFVQNSFARSIFDDNQFEGSLWQFTPAGELISLNRSFASTEDDNGDEDEVDGSRIGRGEYQKEFKVSNFERIDIAGGFYAEVRQGSAFRVVIDGARRDVDDLQVRVEGNELNIDYQNKLFGSGFRRRRDVNILIEMPSLEAVDLSGAVNATVKGFSEAKNLEIDLTGASKATFTALQAESIDVDLTGASRLNLLGTTRALRADLTGACQLNAGGLKAEEATLDLSGASYAGVEVSRQLRASASGASRIRYRGAAQVDKSSSGGSSVEQSDLIDEEGE
jgi:phage shock protein PspC (stress-responsive transcriptional regulator)